MDTRLRWPGVGVLVGLVAPAVQPAAGLQADVGPARPGRKPHLGRSGCRVRSSTRLIARHASGAYGNLDRLVVIRNGYAVVNHRYARDCGAVSRGTSGPLGCGDGRADAAKMDPQP